MSIEFQTCDLCDAHQNEMGDALRVLPPVFKHFGGRPRFAGQVVTVKCFEDNSLVKQGGEIAGQGRVLVVDGGASLRKALLGGNLAATAACNGWAGVLIYGSVRDVAELRAADVGICALGLIPMPTQKRGEGQKDCAVDIAGIRIRSDDWLYADEDGVVVACTALHQ